MDTQFIQQLAVDVAEEVGTAIRPYLPPPLARVVEAVVQELVLAAFDCYATESARRLNKLAVPKRKRSALIGGGS